MKNQKTDRILTAIRVESLTKMLEWSLGTEYNELREMYISEAIDYLDAWRGSIFDTEEEEEDFSHYGI
uniref:Uncharacterized protein n=1 Tax=uncultured prokaryote TaxID=198431 RepID=A0A0H5Q9M3_9ZZZZ|nr:hypothetical protein [uncultured prokaryote]